MKICPVKNRGYVQWQLPDFLAPAALRGIVTGPEGDVVNASSAHAAMHQLRLNQYIDVAPQRFAVRSESVSVPLFFGSAKSDLLQYFGRQLKSGLTQGYAEKSAYGVFRWHIAVAGIFGLPGVAVSYQFKAHPVRIGEAQHRVSKSLRKVLSGNARVQEP